MDKIMLIRHDTKPYDEDYMYTYDRLIDNIEHISVYVKYINDLIDECDSFFISYNVEFDIENDKKYDKLLKDKLSYEYFDYIINENNSFANIDTNLYDISDDNSKQFIKNNISFNVSNEYREPIKIKNNNIANKFEKFGYNSINFNLCFLKNEKEVFIFSCYDGYICDYRKNKKINEWKKDNYAKYISD